MGLTNKHVFTGHIDRTAPTDVVTAGMTAEEGNVLSGKTYAADRAIHTGTMADNGAVTENISAVGQTVTIPAGYHNGRGAVQIELSEQAKIIPENILRGTTILGVEGDATAGVDLSHDTVAAPALLAGVTAHDANEAPVVGTMPENGAVGGNISAVGQMIIIPAGHTSGGTVQLYGAEEAKIIPGNIKSGTEILGVTGSYSGEPVVTQDKTVTSTLTAQTVTADAGYDALGTVTVNPIPSSRIINEAGGVTLTIG